MGRNLYKLTKMFDDVIIMSILRRHQNVTAKKRFLRVFAEYLKNGSIDFHQTYVIFRQLSILPFEIKRLKTGHLLLPW